MKKLAVLVLPAVVAGFVTAGAQTPGGGAIVRLDPALDRIVSADAKVESLKADYFGAIEGPVWVPERAANLAFGDADSKTLYMVGGRSLWRLRVNIPGIRP